MDSVRISGSDRHPSINDLMALVGRLEEEIATANAQRDRKVIAQRKEIVRLLAVEKDLRAEMLAMQSTSEFNRLRQRDAATIAIQRRSLDERQSYIDEVKRKLRGLATDGDKFQ